ncbi:MAG TPA: cytochrome c peroxidase [Cytophagaceae bacterium]|nr:cytochrome c peroxidase [Cytophagaceae bacterium]
MKITFSLLSLALFLTALVFSCSQEKADREKTVAGIVLQQVDSFVSVKNKLLEATKNNKSEQELQQLFLEARNAYKKMEWATEYFSPMVSRLVNGAPVIEVERYSATVFEPAGLQVIEGFLFPHYDTASRTELLTQLEQLQSPCDKYKIFFSNVKLLDWQIYDAAKLELFRIETMGITGFDNPLTLHSMEETSIALQSLKEVMQLYIDKEDSEQLISKLENAIQYLGQHRDFNTFDRAEFIAQYANPVTTAIANLEGKQKTEAMTYNRLLNQNAKTLFDTNAFNVNAYAPNPWSFVSEEKIALGKVLFYDPVLSGDNSRSCQSCHMPEKAFADGMISNTVLNSTKSLNRNTPSLINAAFQPAQFNDIRAVLLEEQIDSVIHNKNEMHGSLKVAAKKLWEKESYRTLFSKAYPANNRQAIDTLEILNALASYIRSLTSLNSRFDEYMRGNKAALTVQEIEGFNLFMGKAKCGTCHYMPLFNGAVPPMFMKIETEVLGVPVAKNEKTIDPDLGRYASQKIPDLKYSFKTPTVRNATLTAPYMHNGVFSTLEEVIDFYNQGGGVGMGIDLPNQTLSPDKLNLSEKEKAALIAFIKSLESKP